MRPQAEVTDSGITVVKARHPEFFLDLEEPTSLHYGYYGPEFFRDRKLKAFRVLSYTTDYRSHLSDLERGDFVYVLHRFDEDECPKRYVVVTGEKLRSLGAFRLWMP